MESVDGVDCSKSSSGMRLGTQACMKEDLAMNQRLSKSIARLVEFYSYEWLQQEDMRKVLRQFLQDHKDQGYDVGMQGFQDMLATFEKLDPSLMARFKKALANVAEGEKREKCYKSSTSGMHLSDLLASRSIAELKQIAKANAIVLPAGRKNEMVQCLQEQLPPIMESRIIWLDISRVRWIHRTIRNGGIWSLDSYHQPESDILQQHLETGFLFPVRHAREKAIVVPIEFRHHYNDRQLEHQDDHARFVQQLKDVSIRYLALYGLLPLKFLCSELSTYFGTNITKETLMLSFGRGMKHSAIWEYMIFHDGEATYITTLDEESREKLRLLQSQFQYGWKIFYKTAIGQMIPDDELTGLPSQNELEELLTKHVGLTTTIGRLREFITKVQWGLRPDELATAISKLVISIPQESLSTAEELAMLFASHIPQWVWKGHTTFDALP